MPNSPFSQNSGRKSIENRGVSPSSYWRFFIFIILLAVIFKYFYYDIIAFFVRVNWFRFNNINSADIADAITTVDNLFLYNFIEWFGVVYGFLVPLIMVKVWEQFDKLEREFDKEADAVTILFEDTQLLDSKCFSSLKIRIFESLIKYVSHVEMFYKVEHELNDEAKKARVSGNAILKQIRPTYFELVHGQKVDRSDDPILSELLNQLNNIMDARGDRIALAKQRLFDSLRNVSKITSVIWLTSFFLLRYDISDIANSNDVSYYIGPGVIGWTLIAGVTFLVVFVLTVIEDLDEPFYGYWKLDITPWTQIREEMEIELSDLQTQETDRIKELDIKSQKSKRLARKKK